MTQDLPHDGHDEFRKAFAQALFEPLDRFSGGLAGSLSTQAGFAVYRNTVAKACIDALAANFPVVLRLVGAAWFHAMAASYVRQQPPRDARLLRYGEGLPAFLQEFATAHSLAYLYGVASLDWYWTQAHISADAVPVHAADLVELSAESLSRIHLRTHPATRWAWFDQHPAYTLWRLHRESPQDAPAFDNVVYQGEGALLTRPGGAVCWTSLSRGGVRFLESCAVGRSLGWAATEAAEIEPGLDLAALLAKCLGQGALTKG